MNDNKKFRKLPSVNAMLESRDCALLIERRGRETVKAAVRMVLADLRLELEKAAENAPVPDMRELLERVHGKLEALFGSTLKPVINATGIVLHTNLGRAPLGEKIIAETSRVAAGYSTLEYDPGKAARGYRHTHVREALKFLTGAEDAVVVNNNAAAVMLSLRALAACGEIIVSRGELVEIGGAFRVPDVMAESGAVMVEVGTTNRTRLSDYEKAINENTKALFKAHLSNFTMTGFVEEVSTSELARLAHSHGLPVIYDLGSGLLNAPESGPLADEPDVLGAIDAGVDLVSFSADKLLGGPQAGIIIGRGELVEKISRHPLMRTLRPGKLTLAALSAVCRAWMASDTIIPDEKTLPAAAFLHRSPADCSKLARRLAARLKRAGIRCRVNVVESFGRTGGGSAPESRFESYAVELLPPKGFGNIPAGAGATFAESVFRRLLEREEAVVGILREGRLLLDVFAVFERQLPALAEAIVEAVAAILNTESSSEKR